MKSAARTRRTVEPRAWQRMLSGRRLDLLDPSPLDVEIEDIAHGLARVARWNGQTVGEHAFSVAQHCVTVEAIVVALEPATSRRDRLIALLHDAPEYVIGDMISPFKNALGLDYRAFEDRLQRAIHQRFGLPLQASQPLKSLIKRADLMAAHQEAVQLAGFTAQEADGLFTIPPPAARLTLTPQSPQEAEAAYLARFRVLAAER